MIRFDRGGLYVRGPLPWSVAAGLLTGRSWAVRLPAVARKEGRGG